MTQTNSNYVLGLTPDVNGIGWSAVDFENHRVLASGTHLFPAPINPKTKETLASQRRALRAARVHRRRSKYLAKHLLTILKEHGLVPAGEGSGWLQPNRGERPIIELRGLALDEAISKRELAQLLYFYGNHRGYGKGEIGDDAEGKKMLKAISENRKALWDGGYRTVGEMFSERGRMRNSGKDYSCMVSHEMVLAEVHEVMAAQERLGGAAGCAGEPLERDWLSVVEWARPTFDTDTKIYARVGECAYFAGLKRAAKADLSSEMLCLLERLKHLRLVTESGDVKSLSGTQCRELLDVAFSDDGIVTYRMVRNVLGAGKGGFFKEVKDESREVWRPRAWQYLREGLPKDLLDKMRGDFELADSICEGLAFASSPESLEERLEATGTRVSDEWLDALEALDLRDARLRGYGSRSRKAVSLLLDTLLDDEVESLYDAEAACGLLALRTRAFEAAMPMRLVPYEVWDPTCTNPVVLRATSRMRKVVNAVIARFGMPSEVRVELSRELASSKKAKLARSKNMAKRNKEKKEDRELAARILGVSAENVNGSVLRKLSMWHQQGEVDLMTGERIDVERLVRDSGYTWLCHILPLSVSGDDGMSNKVLALSTTALAKGKRSPHQWMSSDEDHPDWEAFVSRVAKCDLPDSKKSLLLWGESDTSATRALGRTMSDKRYISAAIRDYLAACLIDQDGKSPAVSVVSYKATSLLSRAWGQQRDRGLGPRERALSASVVCACDATCVRRCGAYSERRFSATDEERKELLASSQPWPTFFAEAAASAALSVPSHMTPKRMRGEALEQTNRRMVELDEETGYAVLTGGERTVGNYKTLPDGTVRIVSGMACLRLWFDPEARRGKGGYVAEPVYYDDIPSLSSPGFVPRMQKSKIARVAWPEVPSRARDEEPMALFPGQALRVQGRLFRYRGYGIATNSWILEDPITGEKLSRAPTLASLGHGDLSLVEDLTLGLPWPHEEQR